MRTIAFILCSVFCMQVACAADVGDIEATDLVKKVIESPQEYDIPENVLKRLEIANNTMNRTNIEIEKRERDLEIATTKLALMKLEKQRIRQVFGAEFRLFLTSKGVPYDDLPRWQLQNKKAVRVK